MVHKKGICINCGKLISRIKCIRCITCSNKYREKISYQWSKESKNKIKNEGNSQWKGEIVGSDALHRWVERHKPKIKFCQDCKIKKPYDLANISGEYKRDINDYEWLCRSCHMKKDGRLVILQINNNIYRNRRFVNRKCFGMIKEK